MSDTSYSSIHLISSIFFTELKLDSKNILTIS